MSIAGRFVYTLIFNVLLLSYLTFNLWSFYKAVRLGLGLGLGFGFGLGLGLGLGPVVLLQGGARPSVCSLPPPQPPSPEPCPQP